MNKADLIPVFDLREGEKAGFFVQPLEGSADRANHEVSGPHRDNACSLFLLRAGTCRLLIDFEESWIEAPAYCLIHPEQVQSWLGASRVKGWMIDFDTGLVTQEVLPLAARLTRLSITAQQATVWELIGGLT